MGQNPTGEHSSYPEPFARFYDVIYSHLRTVDRDFFLWAIRETRGPVLEIGVGTGRLFLDAINAGADIYGIDISLTMRASKDFIVVCERRD